MRDDYRATLEEPSDLTALDSLRPPETSERLQALVVPRRSNSLASSARDALSRAAVIQVC